MNFSSIVGERASAACSAIENYVTSTNIDEARRPHTFSRPYAFKDNKTKKTKKETTK